MMAQLGAGIGKAMDERKAMKAEVKATKDLLSNPVMQQFAGTMGISPEQLEDMKTRFEDGSLSEQAAVARSVNQTLGMVMQVGGQVMSRVPKPEGPQPRMVPKDQIGNYIKSAKEAGFDYTIAGYDKQGNAYITKESPMGSAPSVTVNTGDRLTAKLQEKKYESLITRRDETIQPAVDSVPHLMAMEELLGVMDEEGGIIAGSLAKQELAVKAFANRLGANFEDVEKTQAYVGLSAKRIAEVIKAFGSGTGLSDADREFAAKAAAGDITMDRKALKRLIDLGKKGMEVAHQNYMDDVERSFGGEGQEWAKQSLWVPSLNFNAMPSDIAPIPSTNVPEAEDAGGDDDFLNFIMQ
jgi:hypothetical protein